MEPSSSSSSSSRCRQSPYSNLHHERFLRNHLRPAITGKSCPICLNLIEEAAVITVCFHAYCYNCIRKWSNLKRKCPLCNAQFASLFVEIDLNSKTFRTKQLSALRVTKFNNGIGDSRDSRGRRIDFMAQRRAIGASREELNVVNRRTRPLPRQRSFGQSKMLPPGVTKERTLQWRASIYEQNLRAVPCPTRRSIEQDFMGRNSNRQRLLERIEPWIHRELHAVLGDSDPAILVHLVTSLFISTLEETNNNHLETLRPFLLERTSTFWHELRCFAESSFNMETCDTVVEYVKCSN